MHRIARGSVAVAFLFSCLLSSSAFAEPRLAGPADAVGHATTHVHTAPRPPLPGATTSVMPSTIARSGWKPGDPVINSAGAVRGVKFESLTHGANVTQKALFGSHGRPLGSEGRQGAIGDCYLIATMSAYAQFHPGVVKSVFVDPSSGTLRKSAGGHLAARFFEKSPTTEEFHPADPTVYDGRAPVHAATEKLPLAKAPHGKIWGPMMEYTYAKFRDQQGGGDVRSANPDHDRIGYNRIGNGGYPNHVMRALTGHDAETVNVDLHHEDAVWKKMVDAQRNNQVVVVGSMTKRPFNERVRDEVKDGHLAGVDPKTMKMDDDKWVGGHAFAAWGDKEHPFVFEQNGERMIRLRNPWGSNAPGVGSTPPNQKPDDGISTIPFREFVLRYDRAWIGAGQAARN